MTIHEFENNKDIDRLQGKQPVEGNTEMESKLRVPEIRNPMNQRELEYILANNRKPMEPVPDQNQGTTQQITEQSIPQSQQGAYAHSNEHLWHCLQEADAWVRAQTVRWQHTIASTKPEQYWGMVHITEDEINAFLESPFMKPDELPSHIVDAIAPHWQNAEAISNAIRQREASTPAHQSLKLQILETLFGLNDYDMAVIKLCLLPELDSRYRRLYGYLLDDATRIRPNVELITQILQPKIDVIDQARLHFAEDSALISQQIILLTDTVSHNDPLSARSVQLDRQIIDFLLGQVELDARLQHCAVIDSNQQSWDSLVLEDEQVIYLRSLADWLEQNAQEQKVYPLIFFHGVKGNGQLESARALSASAHKPMLIVDAAAAVSNAATWTVTLRLIFREAKLHGASIYWANAHVLNSGEQSHQWQYLRDACEQFDGLVFVESESLWDESGHKSSKPFIRIDHKHPSFPLRQLLWDTLLPEQAILADDANDRKKLVSILANSFQLTHDQIAGAINTAKSEALRRNPHQLSISLEDFYEGCRRQASHGLMSFARLIEPRAGLTIDQLILPSPNKRQFDELRSRIRYRSEVYSNMGFEQRLSLGKGLIVVFAGSSGTGKTMAAELLAKEYGVQLFKVDLSAVVSKYVGETEKNLAKVFNEAEDANAILLFDEGESLFGKRGEVKEARDRWANIEASFLLQRVEEYRGVVIVTTNRRQDIEPAFWRRIDTVVEFPRPDAEARFHIWQGMFPAGVNRPSDEELKTLADRFNLAGGNIKNAAVDAGFRAMEDACNSDPEITIRHLVLGIAREEQKIGKALTKGDFGEQYYHWVTEALL